MFVNIPIAFCLKVKGDGCLTQQLNATWDMRVPCQSEQFAVPACSYKTFHFVRIIGDSSEASSVQVSTTKEFKIPLLTVFSYR